jgi:hypothetical protein
MQSLRLVTANVCNKRVPFYQHIRPTEHDDYVWKCADKACLLDHVKRTFRVLNTRDRVVATRSNTHKILGNNARCSDKIIQFI